MTTIEQAFALGAEHAGQLFDRDDAIRTLENAGLSGGVMYVMAFWNGQDSVN